MESANSQLLPNRSEKEENFANAMQALPSSVLPFVLHSTIELEVFEILAKAGADHDGTQLSASQIVSQMPSKNPDAATMLDGMLYVLASYSLLTCSILEENGDPIRLYGLSPVGKLFVHDEDGASLGPLLALLQDKDQISSCFAAEILGGLNIKKIKTMEG